MRKNLTPKKGIGLVHTGSNLPKIVLMGLALLISICSTVNAQNTDLPNPTPNVQTAPAGSLVIAMDNTYQAVPGYFNLKAYGLVVTLMNNNKRVRWVITAGKAKDGTDISVTASSITIPTVVTASSKITVTIGSALATVTSVVGTLMVGMTVTAPGVPAGTKIASIITPSQITLSTNAVSTQILKDATYKIDTYPVANRNFKAGPFIIFPADTIGVRAIINAYNAPLITQKVNVFMTTNDATADIRYDMNGFKPKAAILNDGGNGDIHVGYMINGGIPTINYLLFPSATGLTTTCFTFASEAHNTAQGSFIDSVKAFVTQGGNFLAQCHAIPVYENFVGGHFQSTNGIDNNNINLSGNIGYINNDLSISQFEGYYNPNQNGNTRTWTLLPGSTPQNNFFGTVHGNTLPLSNVYGVSGAKLRTGKGGMVYYLGNHEFLGNSIEVLNGQRMYLNAFLTPAASLTCATGGVLTTKLNYFVAKRLNAQQVQLDWSTVIEQNAKTFIIQRAADGINFTEIGRVTAKGESHVETRYNSFDNDPLQGKNFYRLIQVANDGYKSYSDIVTVDMGIIKPGLNIYPNPARGQVTINLGDPSSYNNMLSVFDINGKLVINPMPVTGNIVKLNIGNLTTGTYIVKLITPDGTLMQQKLSVVK